MLSSVWTTQACCTMYSVSSHHRKIKIKILKFKLKNLIKKLTWSITEISLLLSVSCPKGTPRYSHISSPLQSRNKQKHEVRRESNPETNSLKENNQLAVLIRTNEVRNCNTNLLLYQRCHYFICCLCPMSAEVQHLLSLLPSRNQEKQAVKQESHKDHT